MKVKDENIALFNESKRIIEQARENGTYKQLMSAIHEYQKTHTGGIPNHCILTKDKERILKGTLVYGL